MSQGFTKANPGALDTLPIGSTLLYDGSNVPTGYLVANGQAVSRTTYASLFAAIGTTYGVGDGSTTFNLPTLYSFSATPPTTNQLLSFDGTNIVGCNKGMQKISSATASSSATLDFTGLTGYSAYQVVLANITPATNGPDLALRFSTDNGSTYLTSNYSYALHYCYDNAANGGAGGTSFGYIPIASPCSNAGGGGVSALLTLNQALSGNNPCVVGIVNWYINAVPCYGVLTLNGVWTAGSGPVNAIRFLFSSGNIASGTITVYGLI